MTNKLYFELVENHSSYMTLIHVFECTNDIDKSDPIFKNIHLCGKGVSTDCETYDCNEKWTFSMTNHYNFDWDSLIENFWDLSNILMTETERRKSEGKEYDEYFHEWMFRLDIHNRIDEVN